jgi:hypothetical protein
VGGNGRAGAEEGADFRRTYHSAVCRRARPTAVESHWGARDSWSGCGRNMGVCQPRSVRVCPDLCARPGPHRAAASWVTVLAVLAACKRAYRR